MRKSATLILLLLACAGYAQRPAAQTQSTTEPGTTLKVDVKLVNVYVTVTDPQGAPVGGLKKENFAVQEDGKQQTISVFDKESALPISIALAIDTSLSTRHDLPLEQASAKRFAHTIIRPVGVLLLWLVVGSAVVSAFQYFQKFWGRVDGSVKQRRHLRILERRKNAQDVPTVQ